MDEVSLAKIRDVLKSQYDRKVGASEAGSYGATRGDVARILQNSQPLF